MLITIVLHGRSPSRTTATATASVTSTSATGVATTTIRVRVGLVVLRRGSGRILWLRGVDDGGGKGFRLGDTRFLHL